MKLWKTNININVPERTLNIRKVLFFIFGDTQESTPTKKYHFTNIMFQKNDNLVTNVFYIDIEFEDSKSKRLEFSKSKLNRLAHVQTLQLSVLHNVNTVSIILTLPQSGK